MARGNNFKYVRKATNKGKVDKYYFVRYRGTPLQEPPIAMPDDINSPEFLLKYRQLMGIEVYNDFTYSSLISDYKISEEFLNLSPSTAKFYNTYLTRIENMWGRLLVSDTKPKIILLTRDEMAKEFGRGSANNFLTTIRNLISWGVPREYANFNPCDEIAPYKKGEGFLPWSQEAIEFWRKNAEPKLVYAMEYALYLGQRQADLLKLLRSDRKDDVFVLRQNKAKKSMWVPIHSELDKVIKDIPVDSLWCLTNFYNEPWTINSFKSAWNKEKNKEKMKWFKDQGFVFHGLRKNAVVNLLEAGCTPDEVKAITGHETTAMVEHYGKGVNQRKQARTAIAKLEDYKNKKT